MAVIGLIFLWLIAFLVPANAWPVRGQVANTGRTLIGEGDINGASNAYLNIMKWGGTLSLPQGATTTIASLTNANGYPTGPLTTNTSYRITLGNFPAVWYGQTMVVRWTGKGGGTLENSGMTFTPIAITGTGCSFSGGLSAKTTTMTLAGTDCYATFSMALTAGSTTNGSASGLSWLMTNAFGAVTYDGTMAALEFYLLSYEALRNSGRLLLPEYTSLIRSLNPKILRVMDWTRVNGSNVTSNLAKIPVDYVSYNSAQTFLPGFSSGVSGSGTVAFTANAAPNTPVAYTDGEMISIQFTNAAPAAMTITGSANNGGAIQLTLSSGDVATLSPGQRVNYSGLNIPAGSVIGTGFGYFTITIDSATQITLVGSTWPGVSVTNNGNISVATLDVGGRGAKLLVAGDGSTLKSEFGWAANGVAGLTYDGWLDVWIVGTVSPASGQLTSGGLSSGLPIEVIVAMANELGVNLWLNIPLNYDDASVSSTIAYVRNYLNSNLELNLEVSNEVWNFLFNQTSLARRRGLYLGFPDSNSRAENGYYAYRARVVSGLARAEWSPRASSQLKMVLALWAASPSQPQSQSNILNGNDLASVANGGAGNANWISKTGDANYRTTGNRPVDYAEVLSYATYWNGAQLTSTALLSGANTLEVDTYKAAIDAYNSGTVASGYAWIDNDIRNGTRNTVQCSLPSCLSSSTFSVSNSFSGGNNDVVFPSVSAGGSLPTGLTCTVCFVVNQTGSSFKLSATRSGSALTLSGGSGTLTIGSLGSSTLAWLNDFVYAYNPQGINPGWESIAQSYDSYRAGAGQQPLKIRNYEGGYQDFAPTLANYPASLKVSASVTFNIGSSPGVNWAAHPLHNGDLVSFSGGTLPTNVDSGTEYYVTNASTDAFDLTATYNNPFAPFVITLTGSPSGTTTGTGGPWTVNNALNGWKQSAGYGGQFVTDTYTKFINTPPVSGSNHSDVYGWFALQGGVATGGSNSSFSQWSLMPGNTFSTPYAGFDALRSINSN